METTEPVIADGVDEWVALFANREEMAWEYARWIVNGIGNDTIDDWRPLKEAIRRRWSGSGLLYIQRLAWKYVREEDVVERGAVRA